MKGLLKVVLLCYCLLSTLSSVAQQNIQFTQYIFNSISVNPAYAGYKEEWYAQLAARTQWVGLKGAPKTFALSVDGVTNPINKKHGIGLQLSSDRLGPQSANAVYANYAFRMRLNDEDTKRLSVGLAAGITEYGLNGELLVPINPDDPSVPIGKVSNFIPDIRFGIYYSSPTWYMGVSVMDLLSNDQSNNIFRWDNTIIDHIRRKPHAYIIAGALFDLKEGIKMRPSVLWKEDFRGPSSLDINAMFILGDRFWVGGGLRTGVTVFQKNYQVYTGNSLSNRNSFSGIVQVYANDKIRLGYSYDYILSNLSSVQNGTHELTVGVTFGHQARRVVNPRYF